MKQLFLILSFLLSTVILFGQTDDENKKISELKKEIESLKTELETYKSTLEGTKNNLNDTKKVLEEKNKNLQSELDKLQSDLVNKNVLIKEKEELVKQKETLIESMQTIINNSTLTQEQQRSQIELKNQEITNLANKIRDKEDLIEEKERNIESINEGITALKETIKTKEEVIDTKQETINTKTKVIDEKVTKISELQNEIISIKTEKADKRKWLRVVQGVGLYKFRTPNYILQPKSSSEPNVMVISNTNTGEWEGDYYMGFSVMAFDFNKKDLEQRMSIGPFIAFGGKDLFKNFYLGLDYKAWMIHLNVGFNFHEFEVLKSGFNEGDVLEPGQIIPTTNEWKTFIPYFGVSIDTEFIMDLMDKTKK